MGELPPPPPHHLWQVGEPALPLTSCSTLESWPCPLPGPHSTADPVGRGSGELAQGCECGRDDPTACLSCMGEGERRPPHTCPLPLATCRRWESWSQGHESERAGPAPHLSSTVELVSGTRRQEGWPCPAPAAALWKVGPTPRLGNTVELALAWVEASCP